MEGAIKDLKMETTGVEKIKNDQVSEVTGMENTNEVDENTEMR